MILQGILTTEDRVELLRGKIFEKLPKGPKHSASTFLAAEMLGSMLGKNYVGGRRTRFG